MAIITLTELKTYLGDKATELEDTELEAIISEVNSVIQQELNVDVFRECIKYINLTRQNLIDGENKTYYIKNYVNKWFADKNGDGSITVEDVKIYTIDNDGVETNPTISSIDNTKRSITLETAPENVTMYLDYSYSFYDMSTPDNRIKKLAKYLALAYCYFEIDFDLVGTSIKMGNQSISGIGTNSRTAKYNKRYEYLLKELLAYGTSKNKPVNFNVTKPLNYRPSKYYGYRNWTSNNSLGGF